MQPLNIWRCLSVYLPFLPVSYMKTNLHALVQIKSILKNPYSFCNISAPRHRNSKIMFNIQLKWVGTRSLEFHNPTITPSRRKVTRQKEKREFPLAPMGVLAPGSVHGRPSTQPQHLCYLEYHAKFQNPRTNIFLVEILSFFFI